MLYSLIIEKLINHEVTEENVNFWFDFFNEKIFDNVLYPFDEIEIKRTRGYYGEVTPYANYDDPDKMLYKLVLRNSVDAFDFLGTLGHEMVHLYQGQYLNIDLLEPEEENRLGQTSYDHFQSKFSKYGIYIL